MARLTTCVFAVPVAILLGTLALLTTDAHERALIRATAISTLRIETVRLDLERLLADERATRLAHDDATLTRTRAAFALSRAALHRALAAASVDQEAVASAAATLESLVPVRAGVGSTEVGRGAAAVAQADLALNATLDGVLTRRHRLLAMTARNRGLVLAMLATASAALVAVLMLGLRSVRALRREEALEAARLAHAITQMPLGVAVFDNHDRLRFWNEPFRAALGAAAQHAQAGAPFEALTRDVAAAVPDLFSVVRPAFDGSLDGVATVGGRALEIHRAAMPGGGQLLAATDVTRRVEAEAVAAHAQRMEVLGRLTGGIAHDFNNLLQALDANLAVLGTGALGSADARARLQAIGDGIDRGVRLTRHLLAFARRQELRPTAIAVGPLIESMADLLARTLGDRIEIEIALEAELWPVLGDRAPLENALLNIALNARDAMPTGGTLRVRASNAVDNDGTEWVRIALADTGVGMSEQEQAHATEPFWTTKDGGRGTGLGLSMVHGYAAQSGGRLELDSRKGEGTVATVVLPRAREVPAEEAVANVVMPSLGESVLLVEDDNGVREATRAALEQLGYRVEWAVDADQAAARLADGSRPDLLFSDVMMPGRLGVRDLIERARALLPELPVLLHSGDPDAATRAGVSLDDRTILLGKPWRYAELSRVLRALLTPAETTPALEPDHADKLLPG